MNVSPAEIENYLGILTATPARITAASQRVATARLSFRLDADTWSANDILAHLRSCADVWGKSMRAMIQQDHPTLRYISPRTYIKKTNYAELDFQQSLADFSLQRDELLNTLNGLPLEGWSCGATILANNKTRQQNVLDYARRMALHEAEHCDQIEALLK